MLSMIIKITVNYWNKKAICIKWNKNNTSKLIKIDAFLENQSFFIEIYLFLDQKLKVINQLTLYQSTHISTLCSPHTDFLRFQHTNFDFLLFFFKNYIILISILLFYIILWSHIILELRETMFRKPYHCYNLNSHRPPINLAVLIFFRLRMIFFSVKMAKIS